MQKTTPSPYITFAGLLLRLAYTGTKKSIVLPPLEDAALVSQQRGTWVNSEQAATKKVYQASQHVLSISFYIVLKFIYLD